MFDSALICVHQIMLYNNQYHAAATLTEAWQGGLLATRLNPLKPRDAYMRQQSKPLLVQIKCCGLIGATPLSEPNLAYC